MLSLSTNNREMKSESCLSLAMASQAFKESRQEYFISVQKPCIYSTVKVILINICQDVHRKQALPAPLGRLHHLPPWQRPGWFQKLFSWSELVGQWQDLFKGNLTLLLVLISCEDLLLRRSTKRAPMSCGWPSSWARMAVQVKIIWSRSISPWNTCIWLVWRRWGWFGAVQRCYWRSWGERFEEQAAEEERGSRWSLRMWRKIFACFNKNRRKLMSLYRLCLNQIIFLWL